jgi:hypothetical protein
MMNEPTMEALVERLNRLERENQRWRWLVTVTLAVMALGVVLVQTTSAKVGKVLEAERFVLRDADGTSRAELGVMDGASILLLNDKDGKPGVALSVLPDGPRTVSLLDKDGKIRSVLTARADGDSGLRLFDKNRMHRASLDVKADGRPILRLAPEKSKDPREELVVSKKTSSAGPTAAPPFRVSGPKPVAKSPSQVERSAI